MTSINFSWMTFSFKAAEMVHSNENTCYVKNSWFSQDGGSTVLSKMSVSNHRTTRYNSQQNREFKTSKSRMILGDFIHFLDRFNWVKSHYM